MALCLAGVNAAYIAHTGLLITAASYSDSFHCSCVIGFPNSSYLIIYDSDKLSTAKNLLESSSPSSSQSSSILPGMGSSYGPFVLIR